MVGRPFILIMPKSEYPFPRLRDLPKIERDLFGNWLFHQRRHGYADHPMVGGVEPKDQDFFWLNDYKMWRAYFEEGYGD